jgi:hypothetical protein
MKAHPLFYIGNVLLIVTACLIVISVFEQNEKSTADKIPYSKNSTIMAEPILWMQNDSIFFKDSNGKTIFVSFNAEYCRYEDGYRDALDHFALLNLELELKGERKTFGEMNEILYRRHNIPFPLAELRSEQKIPK